MKKGISIPINTLVMLAIAIIVLLAAVAWFMGVFGRTAAEQSLRQSFDNKCVAWARTNCAEENPGDDDTTNDVPSVVCDAYNNLYGHTEGTTCTHATIAAACGCIKPYGMGGETVTTTTVSPP